MAWYSNGKRMPDWYKPELFDEDYIVGKADEIYKHCIKNCNVDCPHYNELGDDVEDDLCAVDLMLEFYRRWSNLKHAKEQTDV